MSKEKQIEEMVTDINEVQNGGWEFIGNSEYTTDVSNEDLAEYLYNVGYRKQSENETLEAVDMFRNLIVNRFIELCNYNDYGKINLLLIGETIDRIYDDVIAKMKGGAE